MANGRNCELIFKTKQAPTRLPITTPEYCSSRDGALFQNDWMRHNSSAFGSAAGSAVGDSPVSTNNLGGKTMQSKMEIILKI